jgi:hypothetical protein
MNALDIERAEASVLAIALHGVLGASHCEVCEKCGPGFCQFLTERLNDDQTSPS